MSKKMSSIPEKDWKLLSRLKAELLDIACENIFSKVDILSSQRKGKVHKTYLNLWDLIKSEDKIIAEMFDDLKRSNALFKLVSLKHYCIISDKQLAEFSVETQETVKQLSEFR
jgi:uncharacterized protein YutE (UPF0331/DUF86 family)